MKIKFLMDYCGRETCMELYKEGNELILDQQPATELLHFGIAEEVEIKQIHNKLRQVEIGKGTKFIEMYYNPKSYQLGKKIIKIPSETSSLGMKGCG